MPLSRPRQIAPWWEMFGAFAQALFSWQGLVQVLAVALVLWLVDFIPLFFGWIFYKFIFLSYFFRVLSSYAHGAERLPDPDDFLGMGSIFGPPIRFLAASLAIWLPATLWLIFGVGLRTLAEEGPGVLSGPVFVLLIGAGLLFFPGALITAAVSESAIAALNPVITARMIGRIPGQYTVTALACALLTGLDYLLNGLLHTANDHLYVPLLGSFLLQLLSLPLPILTAMIMGRLIYQNGEHFGVHLVGESTELDWPEAQPEGTLSRADTEERVQPRSAPVVDVEGWGQAPARALEAPAEDPGLELNLGSADLPASSEDLAAPAVVLAPDLDTFTVGSADLVSAPEATTESPFLGLQTALEANDFARSLDAYRQILSQGYPQLAPRLELRLANYLEQSGEPEDAVRACQRAVKGDPKGPFAARAVYTAARLLANNLRDRNRATAMYNYLLKQFPGDELAIRAQSEFKFLAPK